MLGSFSRILFTLALFLVVTSSMGRSARADLLVVDFKTDYLPGIEFIAARATIDGGNAESVPVFTDSDGTGGIRITEYTLNSGEYLLEVQLLRADRSVLALRQVLVLLNVPVFAPTILIPRTGDPAPTCEDQLAETQGQLADTQVTLQETLDNLSATQAQLNECQGDLGEFTDDADADGVLTLFDECPDTAAGNEVDSLGCSKAQFCSAIALAKRSDQFRCRNADWSGDGVDRPLPDDCTVMENHCVAME